MQTVKAHGMMGSIREFGQDTYYQVQHHHAASVRRGPWLPEEDRRLMAIISIHGPTNWVRILSLLGSRLPKQCRERYHQNLKPSLNRNPITEEEGLLIEQLVAKHGKKWAEIARHLTGRSDNAIKNWWNGGANRRRRASQAATSGESSPVPGIGNSTFGASSSSGPPSVASTGFHQPPLKQSGTSTQISEQPMQPQTNSNAQSNVMPYGGIDRSRQNSVSQLQNMGAGISHYPKVQQFPQIMFNTSIFSDGKTPASHTNTSQGSSMMHSGTPSAISKPLTRLASFDHPTLPPILPFNRRLGDEDRRHSLGVAALLESSHTEKRMSESSHAGPGVGLHRGLIYSLHYLGSQNGSHHGSPSSLGSRQDSISHDFRHSIALPLTALSSHALRRSSVAPDLFPNPLAGHGGDAWLKHNQLLALLHSPSIVPLHPNVERLLVSSISEQGTTKPSSGGSGSLPPLGIPSYKNLLRSINGTPEEQKSSSSSTMPDRIKVTNLID